MSASVAVEQGVRTARGDPARVCAGAVLAAGAALMLGGLVLLVLGERAGIPSAGHRPAGRQLVGLAAALPVLLLGALMLARVPRHPIGWILCLSSLGLLLAFAAAEYATYSHYRDALPAGRWAGWIAGGRRRRSC